MSIFSFPIPGATTAEISAARQKVHEYVRTAGDPNEAGENGRTLLLMALLTCFEGDGEAIVADLLARGADPNRPSPWATFTTLLTVSESVSLVRLFIESGLRLNDVYEVDGQAGGIIHGPVTLLDHLDAIWAQISPKRKNYDALAKRHAGGLGKRRRFIQETITLLESAGAGRSCEREAS